MVEIVIDVDSNIVEVFNNRIDGTNFESVQEYISFILVEFVNVDSDEHSNDPTIDESHLEALGYL